ncbi:insulin-like receptor [Hylaeus anthracinus]|uniref:insulin-like receptor n=1 Tax=Hylaeus anthracinus TaxID=313031 RepID=UPI0023B97898|nr:insulin-like receptor [Hylaeus anthracinus]
MQKQTTLWTLLFLSVLVFPTLADHPIGTTSDSSKEDGVCQSIDIRNGVRNFSKLKGCRIVEGFVQILLIDNAEPWEYANISFPELREITGYLLLYRVDGLRSIGRLFPNLTVIRGHSLFINYALVAFEVMNLQEIGLHSLTTIQRGSVRFEMNPALCYVDTIDWDLIAKAGRGEHVITGNNPKNGCPVCEKNCPRSVTKPGETLCWNQQHCQQICDPKCENNACDGSGNCCHPSCLGTCTGPTMRDCMVCKDMITADNECKPKCPNGLLEFMSHRCIDEDRCYRMEKPREAYNVRNYPYKPFNGSCVMECPPGFVDEEINGKPSCKKCDGPCQKECAGSNVDSMASAQKLRGCTHITGSLEIQIRGGQNIVKELEDSLSTIEEIDGYLKIVRSFPLISLNFLKNLRIIHGNDIDNSKYSLVVMDNQNLQELWDWSWHRDIKIMSKGEPGKVFFHLNPKLCLYKIETLREKAGLRPFTNYEVASNSNGDKVACNVTELRTRVGTKSPWGAVIEWEPFVHHDARSLLGYVVYFIEAPNGNVTMYDGRDACGGDGWKVDDVAANMNASLMESSKFPGQEEKRVHTHYLSQLKPYTQYAYYVKTYTIATERSGAQSNLTYFRTMPEAPEPPRFLRIWTSLSDELSMSWSPPLNKNGNLTHYRIFGRWEPDDPNFIDQRNYCEEPMLLTDKKAISIEEEDRIRMEEEEERLEEEKKQSMAKAGTCDCTDRENDQSLREKEASSSIAFEDALHNQVYVKRKLRTKRDVGDLSFVPSSRRTKALDREQPIADKMENDTYVVFERLVPSTNLSFAMKSLRHFAIYNIEVQACRAQENDTYKKCSTKSMRTYRTLPLDTADNIPSNTFEMSTSRENNSLTTMVTLQWEEPPQPNGLIVTYHIEYKRVDIQNYKPTVICITRRDFTQAGKSYILKGLQAGNYSVKVRATSLAGNGAFTEVKYFYIEEHNTFGTFWVIFWLVFCVIFAILCLTTYHVLKQKYMRNDTNSTLIATVNPDYASATYVPDEWEVPREKITILKPLGNGSFGMVYEGIALDIVKGKQKVQCAVKTVNKDATERERIEFLNEASVMKGFDAHHVVKLLGVVTRDQPTLVIMELMINGDLKRYLKSHRPETFEDSINHTPPKLERILQMAIEIADGMAYLATKKFVHRDLAARNCMVAEDLTVKVGDFGMTRDVYERDYYRKGSKGLLPVRWMAPESLKDGVFSSYSDVWSYGVVLWEMVTFALQPYQGLSNDQVLRYVIEGGVMERPENCPELLYELMKRTWRHKATKRPTFMDIATTLLKHIDSENFQRVSFYHSTEGIEARNQNRSTSPQTDQHLELSTLQDLPEEEAEGEEDSPLRQDFGDFASFDPSSIKNSFESRYRIDAYSDNSKATMNCHNTNSSHVPLKAGFDDFDGVSANSIVSGKDTPNMPFMEDSLKSVKSSPFIDARSGSRSNLSQLSMSNKSGNSAMNANKQSFLNSPNFSKLASPDYENGSPEILSAVENRETVTLRVDFPSMDTIDIGNEKKDSIPLAIEYVNKSETLNNGYIGGATT